MDIEAREVLHCLQCFTRDICAAAVILLDNKGLEVHECTKQILGKIKNV